MTLTCCEHQSYGFAFAFDPQMQLRTETTLALA
jgi:hypothetical protein